jgi:putative transposase
VDHKQQEQVALHRWAVIAEAAGQKLTAAERGALVRQIAARAHAHPDGSSRRYSRGTIDRWLRAWRKGGLEALRPSPRADTGTVRAHPELFAEASALRLELPGRSAAQIASILFHRHGIGVSERTVRGQLRRAGLHREALAAEPKTYGRYEAARANERWITDVLVGPWALAGKGGLGTGPAVPDRRRPFPAAGGRPVLRARERPRLPGPAAPGDHPARCPRCPICG